MRYVLLVALFVLVTFSCEVQQNQQDDIPTVEREIYDFIESIASFNYQAIRDHCSSDFVMFDDGKVLNLEALIDFVRSFDGKATINYHLEEVKTNIENSFAWTTLRNKAVMVTDKKTTNPEWLQSAVLKKEEGMWKITFYHSSSVRDAAIE